MPLKGKFETSQFVSYHLLLVKEELERLFSDGIFVCLGKIVKDPIISKEEFITRATSERMDMIGFAFSLDHFAFMEITGKGVIAKAVLPVIEICSFAFMITSQGKMLEQAGKNCVHFGVSISYPMLFSISETVEKTRKQFGEAELFHAMRGWIRKETKAAEFIYQGEIVKSSCRIGIGATDEAKKRIAKLEGLELAPC